MPMIAGFVDDLLRGRRETDAKVEREEMVVGS